MDQHLKQRINIAEAKVKANDMYVLEVLANDALGQSWKTGMENR